MGVLGHFYGKYKRSKNFVKKPFNKKNLFPKKEKSFYKSSPCASGRQVHCEKINFFHHLCTIRIPYECHILYAYHTRVMQNCFEIFSSFVKK